MPSYTVELDGTRIQGVTLDKIFDYVSPLHFEVFENTSFKLENDEKDMVQKALNSYRRGRNSRRSVSKSDSTSAESYEDLSPVTNERLGADGRVGRPRPTYSHLYHQRGRRGVNGAGPSRSNWLAKQQRSTSDSEQALNDTAASLTLNDNTKRRRTNCGSYNQPHHLRTTSDSSAFDEQSSSDVLVSPNGLDTTPRMKHKSEDHPVANIPLSSIQAGGSVIKKTHNPGSASSVVSSSTLDSSSSASASAQLAAETLRARMATAQSSLPLANPRTAAAAPSSSDPGSDAEDEASYEIEGILAHRLSDPKTHPPHLGREPITLYHVKWAGYDDLTWEPEGSFDDKAILEEYWRRTRAGSRESDRSGGKGNHKSKGQGRI